MSLDTLTLNQVANAYKLLKAASGVLSRSNQGVVDPATGEPISHTDLNCPTRCRIDASSPKTLGFKFSEGLVQGGDIQVSIPAKGLTFTPQSGDILTLKSWPYVVIDVRPVYGPGGSEVEFGLLVRK